MIGLDTKDLLKLYEITIKEEHFHLESQQKRAIFFMGFISTLIGINIYGLIQVISYNNIFLLFLFLIVSFLIYMMALLGKKSTSRFYNRFLNSVTTRAKIEEELGLTYPRKYKNKDKASTWSNEPLIPTKYLDARFKYNDKDSQQFVIDKENEGYQRLINMMFNIFMLIGLGLLTIIFIGIFIITLLPIIISYF
jgi:hypothetical protein